MKVEQWPTDRPVPYARNPRQAPEAAVAKVAASIKEFGFRQPILVDEEGVIIAGHTRLLAAQRLGLDTVPVIVCADLSPAKAKALRLADNRTAQETAWDYEMLELEIEELVACEYDVSLTGFEPEEMVFRDEASDIAEDRDSASLVERFGVPPFSVLDARQGYWQDRKRAWLALGIASELGRGGGLTMGKDIINGEWSGYEA